MRKWLITRPSPHGENLVAMLQQHGITASHLPMQRIIAGSQLAQLPTQLSQLQKNDYVIVVSSQVIYQLHACHINFPAQLNYFAIGQKTADLLEQLTHQAVCYPIKQENSEHLLALPQLQQVAGQRVLILRGNSGRELLATTLTQRGAKVSYCECYQRIALTYPATIAADWDQQTSMVVTSIEALQQLNQLVNQQQRTACQLLVSSERIALHAKQLGWKSLILVSSAANKILVKCILSLCHNERNNIID